MNKGQFSDLDKKFTYERFLAIPKRDGSYLDSSYLPGDLFFAKRIDNNVFHITRSSDIKRVDGLKEATAFCGANVETDFSTICDTSDVCLDCCKWLNKTMQNAFYDEEQESWYIPDDSLY
jgi:hypothetical protein